MHLLAIVLLVVSNEIWAQPIISIAGSCNEYLSTLLGFMSSCEVEIIQNVSCLAFCSCINFLSKDQIRALISTYDIISKLIQMTNAHGETKIRNDAALALCKLSVEGSTDQIRTLLSAGLMRFLCNTILTNKVWHKNSARRHVCNVCHLLGSFH